MSAGLTCNWSQRYTATSTHIFADMVMRVQLLAQQRMTANQRTYSAFWRLVTTSMPVCAQNAPLTPGPMFSAVGQLVQ